MPHSVKVVPHGLSLRGGVAEQLEDSFNQLGLALAAAVLLIYVVLVWIFRSLIQPALLLVAIPFVLGFRRDVSAGQRIVVGVTLGIGFYLFDKVFGHLGLIYEMDPIFSSVFPASFALVLALIGLWRSAA